MSDDDLLTPFEDDYQTTLEDGVRQATGLTTLKSDLANMKAIWDGPAASDYKRLQEQWDKALTDLNQIMQEISTTLEQSAQHYAAIEKQNQSAWA